MNNNTALNWVPHGPRRYPVGALGRVLGAAVSEHHTNTQIAVELIGPAALGAMAIACQDLVDVKRPNMAPSPCSLNICIIATSGEGKDAGSRPFIRPIEIFEEECVSNQKSADTNFELEKKIWNARERNLLTQSGKENDSEKAEDLLKELKKHNKAKPERSRNAKLIFNDATVGAVTVALCTTTRACGIYSMEGSGFLNGTLGRDMTFWNRAWQGDPISRDRLDKQPLFAKSPRVSILFGIQPEPFARYVKSKGKEALDLGYFPRFLFSCPPTTQGMRYLKSYAGPTEQLQIFTERCTELLKMGLSANQTDEPRKVLGFEQDAQRYFSEILTEYQCKVAPGMRFACIAGHAIKGPEIMARTACILHTVDDLPGEISLDTLLRAKDIIEWHVEQFFELFSRTHDEVMIQANGWHLLQVLKNILVNGRRSICEKDLSRWMPFEWPPRHLKSAIKYLFIHQLISITRLNNRDEIVLRSFQLS